MARLVGLVLLVLAIFLGVSVYTNGARETLAGAAGAEAPDAFEAEPTASVSETRAAERRTPGRAAPSAITSRVRERVTGAIAEGARRHSGE